MDTSTASGYLVDASGYTGRADAVHVPSSIDELRGVLIEASRNSVPVTVSGAGTGVTGGRVPHGGWVVSLERFDQLEVYEGEARAGAGVLLKDLQAAAKSRRQFYAPDPTENSASVGGTIATNASGSRSFRYGDTRRHVLGLTIVQADGSLRHLTRGMPPGFVIPPIRVPATTKHTAGYYLRPEMDELDVFVGSEGTLGVIVEARLRLLPLAKHVLAGVVFFDGVDPALEAVEAWRGVAGLRMLEYLDAGSLGLLRDGYPDIPAAAESALLVEEEIDADEEAAVDAWIERVEASGASADGVWFGSDDATRERFRRFRHALPERVNSIVRRNGFVKIGTDFAVPLARNAEMMDFYRARLDAQFPGRYVIFGHIGDAHLHVNILPATEAEATRGRELTTELAAEAVRLGGTVSAEHGLGKRKAHLLRVQYSQAEIEAMQAVRRMYDPLGLLGQGTMFG